MSKVAEKATILSTARESLAWMHQHPAKTLGAVALGAGAVTFTAFLQSPDATPVTIYSNTVERGSCLTDSGYNPAHGARPQSEDDNPWNTNKIVVVIPGDHNPNEALQLRYEHGGFAGLDSFTKDVLQQLHCTNTLQPEGTV
jgi:hypothetical protein